jgi:hypothetical protein
MSEKVRGSDKLKETCETMAGLTAEDINQVAGGVNSLYETWWIRGIPAFRFANQNPAAPVIDAGGFNQQFGS